MAALDWPSAALDALPADYRSPTKGSWVSKSLRGLHEQFRKSIWRAHECSGGSFPRAQSQPGSVFAPLSSQTALLSAFLLSSAQREHLGASPGRQKALACTSKGFCRAAHECPKFLILALHEPQIGTIKSFVASFHEPFVGLR